MSNITDTPDDCRRINSTDVVIHYNTWLARNYLLQPAAASELTALQQAIASPYSCDIDPRCTFCEVSGS